MNDNVHDTEPNERTDLGHTDTVSTDRPNETPEGAAAEDAPIGLPVDRDPTKLGDDIPADEDLIQSSPSNTPLGRAPGM